MEYKDAWEASKKFCEENPSYHPITLDKMYNAKKKIGNRLEPDEVEYMIKLLDEEERRQHVNDK